MIGVIGGAGYRKPATGMNLVRAVIEAVNEHRRSIGAFTTLGLLGLHFTSKRADNWLGLTLPVALSALLSLEIYALLKENWPKKRKTAAQPTGFRFVLRITDLFLLILPSQVRNRSFEPAYNDHIASYLESGRGRSMRTRALLTGWFLTSVTFMLAQSLAIAAFDWLRRTMFPPIPRL